jgi:hypothetical protein
MVRQCKIFRLVSPKRSGSLIFLDIFIMLAKMLPVEKGYLPTNIVLTKICNKRIEFFCKMLFAGDTRMFLSFFFRSLRIHA